MKMPLYVRHGRFISRTCRLQNRVLSSNADSGHEHEPVAKRNSFYPEFTSDAALRQKQQESSSTSDMIRQIRSVRHEHHNVLLIQPRLASPSLKPKNTSYSLMIEEAKALALTLPGWQVSGVHKVRLRHGLDHPTLFRKGQIDNLTTAVRSFPGVSAAFVNVPMLSGSQFFELARSFRMPVFDRYSVILLIFKHYARSREARLQISLAEIPYLRQRMRELKHPQDLQLMDTIGLERFGGAETYWQNRRQIIDDHEARLKKQLDQVRKDRAAEKCQRDRRSSSAWNQQNAYHRSPVIAVIGYTNAGKTSLIRRLTHDSSAIPEDRLFATLDVTLHSGMLRGRTRVTLMDTVGFIADIPPTLITSFAATLDDVRSADLLIHVRDASHPDRLAQAQQVRRTLESMELPARLMDNMLEVWNKIDLLEGDRLEETLEESVAPDPPLGQVSDHGLGVNFDSDDSSGSGIVLPEGPQFSAPVEENSGDSWVHESAGDVLNSSTTAEETTSSTKTFLAHESCFSAGNDGLRVSCLTKEGLPELAESLETRIFKVCGFGRHTFLLPSGGDEYSFLVSCGSIEHSISTPDGKHMFVLIAMSTRSYQIFRGKYKDVKEIKSPKL